MWNRIELKEQGKQAFKANYWPCVAAGVLLVIATGGGSGISSGASSSQQVSENSSQYGQEAMDALQPYLPVIAGVTIVAALIALALAIFVFGPLEVGCKHYFRVNLFERAQLNILGIGFRNEYIHTVGTMFLSKLYIALWSLLLLIPGIVKAYSYRMVPYILAEHPEMTASEIITRSREMMNGHKWKTFVLDLSFLGWILLSVITCGLVGIFYLIPYEASTDAALYEAILAEYSGSDHYIPAQTAESSEDGFWGDQE